MRLFFFCLLLVTSALSVAQNDTKSIRGKVVDDNNDPLPGALVYLKKTASETVIAHGVADGDGNFVLKWERSGDQLITLEIRMLGFEKLSITLDSLDAIGSNIFILQDDPQLLQEVVISESRPVSYKNNDTIIYNLDKVKEGSERNLEDILKKLPNFNIGENGRISYKGTEIRKIFVDGEDLSSDDYKRISKSFKAQVVKDVEAIERFVENRLLSNSVQSSDVALNINIETQDQIVTGAATFKYGLSNRRDIDLNIFKLNKGLKAFGVFQTNNVGLQTEPYSDQFSMDLIAQFTENEEISSFDPFLDLSVNPDLPLSTQINLNNETTGAITAVMPLSSNSKWLSQVRYYSNDLREVLTSEVRNFLDFEEDQSFVSSESSSRMEDVDGYYLTNRLNFGIGEKTEVVLDNRLSHTSRLYDNQLLFGINSESLSDVNEFFDTESNSLIQNLSITKKIHDLSALQMNASYGWSDYSQRLDVIPADFISVSSSSLDFASQKIESNNSESIAEMLWFTKRKSTYYKLFSGIRLGKTAHFTELVGDASDSVLSRNDLNNDRFLLYGGVNILKNWRLWEFDFTGRINQFSGDVAQVSSSSSILVLYPSLESKLSYSISRNSRLRMTHTFNRSFYNDREVIQSLILTDFRSVERGANQLIDNTYHKASLSYFLESRASYIEVLANIDYRYNQTDYIFSQTIENGGIENSLEVGPSTGTFGGYASLAKFFPGISTRFELLTQIERQAAFIRINDFGPSQLLLDNRQNQLKFGTSFDFPVNVFGGVSFVNQRVIIASENVELSSREIKKVDLDIIFKKNQFRVSQKNELFFVENESLLISKINASYSPNKKAVTIYMNIDNLLDVTTFNIPVATQFMEGSTNHLLLGRVILVGLSFNF